MNEWRCGECGRVSAGDRCDFCGQDRAVSEVLAWKPRLLPDGAVLVEYRLPGEQSVTSRLEPGTPGHADAYRQIQDTDRSETPDNTGFRNAILLALILPISALITATNYLLKAHLRHAVAVFLAASLSVAAYTFLLYPLVSGSDFGSTSASDVARDLRDAVRSNDDGTLTDTTCSHRSGNEYRCLGDLDREPAAFDVIYDTNAGNLIYQQTY
jgi:hypothetical protein